ncbi:MAG: hypothetical protein J5596_01355 [Bacteroidaceae bacterium]|nr:hypothetical protein [Bacteroidaceae bacterium]
MKVRYKSLFAVLGLLFLLSCDKKPILLINSYDVDYRDKSETLVKGKLLHQEVIGANGMVVFDTLLMITNNNPKGQLLVYSTNSLDSVGRFCTKGRANNEFLGTYTLTDQAYYREGHVILPLVDYLDNIKEVDVTESIIEKKTVIANTFECVPLSDGITIVLNGNPGECFVHLKNVYDGRNYKETITKSPVRYLVKENQKKEHYYKIFRRLVKTANENETMMPYVGKLVKHPSKNIIVNSFLNMDYLLFFDLDNNNIFAIHQSGSISFDDTYEDEGDDFLYFLDSATSPDYVLFTYMHGEYSLKEKVFKDKCQELLAFDWNGNFIKSIKLDRLLSNIEYDPIHKKLFGITTNEDLYVYDLENILP